MTRLLIAVGLLLLVRILLAHSPAETSPPQADTPAEVMFPPAAAPTLPSPKPQPSRSPVVTEQSALDPCEAVRPAIVTIYAGREIGSGSIVGPQGLVLTSLHVVRDVADDRLRIETSTQQRFAAVKVAIDATNDLALLQLGGQAALPTVPLAQTSAVQVGESVCAIGAPYGRSGTISRGNVRKILEDGDVQSLLRLHPGDSGGPLINAQGELIGVNRAIWQSRSGANTGISFATNLSAAQTLIEQNRAAAAASRSSIAALPPHDPLPAVPPDLPPDSADFPPAVPDFAPPDLSARRQLPLNRGARLGIMLDSRSLVVKTVQPGSPAAQAGLNPGDRLLAMNGTMLSSVEDLIAFLEQQPDSVVVTIDRQQQRSNVRINFD